MRRCFALTLLFSLFLGWVPVADAARMPRPKGWVSDTAGVISDTEEQRLEAYLSTVKRQTGAEIAVVTVRKTEGDVKMAAVELFEAWGIGQKGKDNGLLIFMSIEDRRVEIEVGYGLEGTLPDGKVGRIINMLMLPAFKAGNYTGGVVQGVRALAGPIAQEAGVRLPRYGTTATTSRQSRRRSSPLASLIHLLLIVLFLPAIIRNPWLLLFMGGGRSYGGSSYGGFGGGGFSSGGFGGFGGGFSGGGGAGGSW